MHGVWAGMGHEKEPKQPHGPKERGKTVIHSHSHRPKRRIKGAAMRPKVHGKRESKR
jgi:hypothetical protein